MTAAEPIQPHSPDPDLRIQIGQRFNPYRRFNGCLIPEAICKLDNLSPGAKLTYGRLARYGGEDGNAYPALKTLGKEIGMSESQARGYVKELEAARLIEVDRDNRHYQKDGSGGSNYYYFVWHEVFAGGADEMTILPPLRNSGGVPLRNTAPPTPAENTTQRESGFSRESSQENQSKTDYQPTNRKQRDSHAGVECCATDENAEHPTSKKKPPSQEESGHFTAEEWDQMSVLLNFYGSRRTMSHHMQESAPPVIVERCLEIAQGVPLSDVRDILRHKCVNRGFDPGTRNGPKGWGWFPTVLESELRSRREQFEAATVATRRKHWSEYEIVEDLEMGRMTSAFDTLDELEATA